MSTPLLATGHGRKNTDHVPFFQYLIILSMNAVHQNNLGDLIGYFEFEHNILHTATAFEHEFATETITSLRKVIPQRCKKFYFNFHRVHIHITGFKCVSPYRPNGIMEKWRNGINLALLKNESKHPGNQKNHCKIPLHPPFSKGENMVSSLWQREAGRDFQNAKVLRILIFAF